MNPLTPEQLAVWLPVIQENAAIILSQDQLDRRGKAAVENCAEVCKKYFNGEQPDYVKGLWVTGA